MDIAEVTSKIKNISAVSEDSFLSLARLFPTLMAKDSSSTALKILQQEMNGIADLNEKSIQEEKTLFTGYGDKYNPLFEQLNKKIEELSELDRLIAGMKENSEQMELIALNAMVISIKSGEKGHAFSRITENLQRLSNDMFLFSDKLLEEEKNLLSYINDLKKIFEDILNSQKKLSATGTSGSSDISALINRVNTPLSEMDVNIGKIYPRIQKAMECLQLQDIVRQALEHVGNSLEYAEKCPSTFTSAEQELDDIQFKIELYTIAKSILESVNKDLTSSMGIFQTNWDDVTNTMSILQTQKTNFQVKFLDTQISSSDNILATLDRLIGIFQGMINEFVTYQVVQKDLLHICQNITEKARTMYAVFENLRPVMSRLHHVRILQQIEVSKNEAISSVRDSVTDMDNLINDANASLDVMQTLLEAFIRDTTILLKTFTDSLAKDNSAMHSLRTSKNQFFDSLQSTSGRIASIINNFTIFPADFEENCNLVDKDLHDIQSLFEQLTGLIDTLSACEQEFEVKREALFRQNSVSSWEIKNAAFNDVLMKLKLATHQEIPVTGAPSGDVTFF